MKIKAVDIARELQISRATVSLALNNKAGVSEQTKQKVFDCKKRLENRDGEKLALSVKERQIIKVLFMHRKLNVVYNGEMDLWTGAFAVFDREAKKMGYSLGVTFFDILKDPVERLVNEFNGESVAGVILCATEMQKQDYELIRKIKKPMIITDNDFGCNSHHRVCIDNVAATKLAVEHLLIRNCKNIIYLANETNIYNFSQRREGFKQAIINNGLEFKSEMIVPMGQLIEDVNENMKSYLSENKLPDAFVMENYQISIGVIKAMKAKGIMIPKDVSLIGIDEMPSYISDDFNLTTIKVDHTNRPNMVMLLLKREIIKSIPVKFKVLSDCKLQVGDSVK